MSEGEIALTSANENPGPSTVCSFHPCPQIAISAPPRALSRLREAKKAEQTAVILIMTCLRA